MALKVLSVLLIIFIGFSFKEVASSECLIKVFQPNLEANTKVAVEEMVKIFRKYWSQERIETLSTHGKKLVRAILKALPTDSYKISSTYFSFTVRYASRISLVKDNPGLCRRARMINATIDYYMKTNDVSQLVNITKWHHGYRYESCIALARSILTDSGCKDFPALKMSKANDCYREGRVYKYKKGLKISDDFLPYPIAELVYPLYKSKDYVDNMMASAMVRSVVSAGSEGVLGDLRILLEMLWASLTKDKECCKYRKGRFMELCETFAKADIGPAVARYKKKKDEL